MPLPRRPHQGGRSCEIAVHVRTKARVGSAFHLVPLPELCRVLRQAHRRICLHGTTYSTVPIAVHRREVRQALARAQPPLAGKARGPVISGYCAHPTFTAQYQTFLPPLAIAVPDEVLRGIFFFVPLTLPVLLRGRDR